MPSATEVIVTLLVLGAVFGLLLCARDPVKVWKRRQAKKGKR